MAKKEDKNYAIEPKDQNALRVMSKIVSVLAIIGRVCLYIAVPFIILGAILSPVFIKDVTIDRTGFAYKSYKIDLKEVNDGLELSYKDSKIATFTAADKEEILKIFDKYSKGRLIALVEATLVFGLVVLILTAIILKKLQKLTDNIHDQKTPFIEENVQLIKSIGKFLIAIFVVSCVGSGVTSTLGSGSTSLSPDFVSLSTILMVFGLSYIFEYGCKLQANTEASIYDE